MGQHEAAESAVDSSEARVAAFQKSLKAKQFHKLQQLAATVL